jgi:hypothetical protein
MVSPSAQAGQFLIDLGGDTDGAGKGEAAGWDVFTSAQVGLGGTWAVTDTLGSDTDVTLTITSSGGNGQGAGVNGHDNDPLPPIDGVTVPIEASDDYFFNSGSAAGSLLFEFKNLDAGTYNVSVFEGRLSDNNGQFGTIWSGVVDDEPGATNTGNYSPDGGSPATLTDITIDTGESVFFRHFDDDTGGTSGIIVRQIPEPSALAITSITSVGGGNWELTLEGEASTGYEFRSSPILDFTPGDLVINLTQGESGDPGSIGGPNDSVLTTDDNGDGTVQMALSGSPADFVRAQIPPPVTVFEDNFDGLDKGWTSGVNAAGDHRSRRRRLQGHQRAIQPGSSQLRRSAAEVQVR